MELILGTFKNLFALFGSVIKIIWSLLKFIFSKCWQFILLIGSLLLGLGAARKASKED